MVTDGGCVQEPEVCDCGCHTGGDKHFFPCCEACPNCGRNIRIGFGEAHKQSCAVLSEPKMEDNFR